LNTGCLRAARPFFFKKAWASEPPAGFFNTSQQPGRTRMAGSYWGRWLAWAGGSAPSQAGGAGRSGSQARAGFRSLVWLGFLIATGPAW